MIRAIDPFKPREYVPESERALPENQRAGFKVKGLDCEQLAEIQDKVRYDFNRNGDGIELGDTVPVTLNSNAATVLTLMHGLLDAKGLVDDEGRPIPFPVGKHNHAPKKDFISHMPAALRREVAGEIMRLSQMSEEDEKNSDAPPSSSPNGSAASAETTVTAETAA